MLPRTLLLAGVLLLTPGALALSPQNGDRKGEDQPPLPSDLVIPPAPVLSPLDGIATISVPPGFRVELVAAEPLVQDPVFATFDGDGRLWVVEMSGYMPDADGRGEHEPVCAIVYLEDADADGQMDRRTVFAGELVLPRSVAPTRGGVLAILPPELVFLKDTDGDGVADERTVLDTGLNGLGNPEHAINGLLPTLDNGFRCANSNIQYHWKGDTLIKLRTGGGGQWGMTKDDLGRIFFNTNPDPLRGDAYPSQYLVRNASLGRAGGSNVRVAHDMTTWPGRINPGVNRGYQKATLRDDFTLARFTGACGPHIYRGAALPDEFQGNAFVCEPTGNMVKRYTLHQEEGGRLRAENAYQGREFLTSTDERFRPVNMCDGPDGGLYIVDLHRGLIQHRIYLTSFLRKQADERGLAAPTGLGRILRLVHEGMPAASKPSFSTYRWTEVAGLLSHTNGWWRDRAQQVVVEEGDGDVDALELVGEVVTSGPTALGRMQALWALEGCDGLSRGLVLAGLADPDSRVRLAAVRVSEPWLGASDVDVTSAVVQAARGAEFEPLVIQDLLSLGEARNAVGTESLVQLATELELSGDRRSAIVSGCGGREADLIAHLLGLPQWRDNTGGRDKLVADLARCVVKSGTSDALDGLFRVLAAMPPGHSWSKRAIVDAVLAQRPKDKNKKPTWLRVSHEPRTLASFVDGDHGELSERVRTLADALAWPGKPGLPPEAEVRPLSPEEQALFEAGRETYRQVCAACHQSTGRGEPGKAPRLAGSPWVTGRKERLLGILMHGLGGPLELDGETWDMEMPALSADDEGLAAIATYVRREWGGTADPITPDEARRVRAMIASRGGPWTVEELEAMPKLEP